MDITDIFDYILKAARLRIDYLGYERPFIEGMGTVEGMRLAYGLFRESLLCFANGKNVDDTRAKMESQFLVLNLRADLDGTIKEFAEKCKGEVSALVLARTYNNMGMELGEILNSVKEDTAEGKPLPDPNGKVAVDLRNLVMKPIFESAKTRFDYKSFADKECAVQGSEKGTERVERILEFTLGYMSQREEVPEEVTYEFLISQIKKGTEPSWLKEFVDCCYQNARREVLALQTLDLAWKAGLSVEKIAEEINFRLAH